jgi:hypothetical protein
VTFEHTARNQHGEVVAVVTRTTLMRCQPANEDQTANRGRPDDGSQADPWSQAVSE